MIEYTRTFIGMQIDTAVAKLEADQAIFLPENRYQSHVIIGSKHDRLKGNTKRLNFVCNEIGIVTDTYVG